MNLPNNVDIPTIAKKLITGIVAATLGMVSLTGCAAGQAAAPAQEAAAPEAAEPESAAPAEEAAEDIARLEAAG